MEEKKVHLIIFHFYMFKATKLNYNIHNKELLVVFEVFSHLTLLLGRVRTFYRYYLLYTHPNTSDPSNSIMNNIYNLHKLHSTQNICKSRYLFSSLYITSDMNKPGSFPCSITLLLIIWLLMTSMELWTLFTRTLVYLE